MNGTTAYVLARKYVKDTIVGMGALKGAPCKIKSITRADGLYTITFEWVDESNISHTSTLQMDDLGSLVVANPNEEATEELEKLKIGNTIYSISGGGGTGDYTKLVNRPKINGVDLVGNVTLNNLGVVTEDNSLTEEQKDNLLGLL